MIYLKTYENHKVYKYNVMTTLENELKDFIARKISSFDGILEVDDDIETVGEFNQDIKYNYTAYTIGANINTDPFLIEDKIEDFLKNLKPSKYTITDNGFCYTITFLIKRSDIKYLKHVIEGNKLGLL